VQLKYSKVYEIWGRSEAEANPTLTPQLKLKETPQQSENIWKETERGEGVIQE